MVWARQALGPGQILGPFSPQAQGGDPLLPQKAVGQLQGVEGGAVGLQFRWRCVELTALVGRGNGQHADALRQGLAGQGQPLAIEQVQVQAADSESS